MVLKFGGIFMNIYVLLIQFVLAVVLVLLYYKFVELRKTKKFTKNNISVDLKLFIQSQNIDMKKITYKKLMRIVAWMNAIDVGIILLITNVVNGILLKFLVAIPAVFIIIFLSYRFVGFILKKKGRTLNES